MKTERKRKVLVYLFGSLGDTIVAIPALRAVRRHFADAEIARIQTVRTDGIVNASEVVPDGLIDISLEYRSETTGSNQISIYFRLWRKIRSENFDAAAYLVISERPEKSVRRDRLFFRSCGIRELIGFHSYSREQLYPVDLSGSPATVAHEAVRKRDRLERDGINLSQSKDFQQPFYTFESDERRRVNEWLAPRRLKPELPLLALAPGCKTPANSWPSDNFIAVAEKLVAGNTCEVMIVGGKAETRLGDEIIETLGSGINAAGKFPVRESGILLSLCDVYFGLDTGTTHLAAAVGTPCLALFHQRDNPGQWFPLGDKHLVIRHTVPCAGCRVAECPKADHPCMTGISVDVVTQKLKDFILANTGQGMSVAERVISV